MTEPKATSSGTIRPLKSTGEMTKTPLIAYAVERSKSAAAVTTPSPPREWPTSPTRPRSSWPRSGRPNGFLPLPADALPSRRRTTSATRPRKSMPRQSEEQVCVGHVPARATAGGDPLTSSTAVAAFTLTETTANPRAASASSRYV